MSATRIITVQDMYNDVPYNVRPGNSYELVAGTEVTMLEPTIALVRQWDALSAEQFKMEDDEEIINPESSDYYLNWLAKKVILCCSCPENIKGPEDLLNMKGLTVVPLKRIVRDFSNLK